MSTKSLSVAVIGAGIIGLSCAWELSKRSVQVTIYDRGEPGRGATHAAAGMLGARYECLAAETANPPLLELCMKGAGMWREFAASLGSISGHDIHLIQSDTLALADDPRDGKALEALAKKLSRSLPDVEFIDRHELRQREPSLSEDVAGAIRIIGEGHVSNRISVKALLAACHKSNVKIVSNTPASCVDTSKHDVVLWTVGASEDMDHLGIAPVKGAAFSLKPGSHLPSSTIRFGNQYIVPKHDRVIIGATVEPGVRYFQPDAALIEDLRAQAANICPSIQSAPVVEVWSGLRPATSDHAPLLGRLSDGRYVATGHYRNGILLAPITAKILADMIIDRKTDDLATAFAPERFAIATA